MSALSAVLCSLTLAAQAPAQPTVGVYTEPGFDPAWARTSPEFVGQALTDHAIAWEPVDAGTLSDAAALTPERYGAIVLPYGSRFPFEARDVFRGYLRAGGSFLSLGGYAFRDLMERGGQGAWTPYSDRVAGERSEEALRQRNILPPVGDIAWEIRGPVRAERTELDGGPGLRMTTEGQGGQLALAVTLDPAKTYILRSRVRTRQVTSPGFAYAAIYEYDDQGNITQWFDSLQIQGNSDWQVRSRVFQPSPGAAQRYVYLGTYLGSGTAEFSELELAPWTEKVVMTTSDGIPGDGLQCRPEQMGLFDPSFALRRAVSVRSAAPRGLQLEASSDTPLEGWAAVGLTGGDNARWVPVLTTCDRYGRPTGPAMAMLYHYAGPYAGSAWAYCGIEGDLREVLGEQPASELIAECVQRLQGGLFLRPIRFEEDTYRPGEDPRVTVRVRNVSARERRVQAVLRTRDGEQEEKPLVELAPKAEVTVDLTLSAADGRGLRRVTVELRDDGGNLLDSAEGAYVVVAPEDWPMAPKVEFRDNVFRVDGKPRVLLGSDNYANVLYSASKGPLAWESDMRLSRDFALDVYENLQVSVTTDAMPDHLLRQIDGLVDLAQRHDTLYMAGWLIGADTWAAQATLDTQCAYLRQVAAHYRGAPWLIHYINGDLRSSADSGDGLSERFRAWLLGRYGSAGALAQAWGAGLEWPVDEIPFPPPAGDSWDSARARDAAAFGPAETERWLEACAGALRAEGGGQPITCEYYQNPTAGVDVPETIKPLDVANIGFFGSEPDQDLRALTLSLAYEDSRARGRGLNIGEFGVKTHPAWRIENGAVGYHVARTEEQQRELFAGLIHIGLGMGVSKFQNWCLRDGDEGVFPWGVFYPGDGTPKPIAYTYRNLGLLTRHVTPRYEPPKVTVLMPDCHRLGAGGDRAYLAAQRAFEGLLRARVPFNVLPDTATEDIPPETEVLWWPEPFCCTGSALADVERFVRAGGKLYLSGDLSWNETRRRTRQADLERLAGVRVVRPGPDPGGLINLAPADTDLGPATEVHGLEAAGCEVLSTWASGNPLLVRNRLGQGSVVYFNSAAELTQTGRELERAYTKCANVLSIGPVSADVTGDNADVVAFATPLWEGGRAIIATNIGSGPARLTFDTPFGRCAAELPARAPLLAAWDASGRWRALSVVGRLGIEGGPSLSAESGACAVRLTSAGYSVAVAPYGPGSVSLQDPDISRSCVGELGELREGVWRTYGSVRLQQGLLNQRYDDTDATLVTLISLPSDLEKARVAAFEPWRTE